MPVTTFPNPLANHLQGDAKKCDRIQPRVTGLQFPALLSTNNTTLDQVRFLRLSSSICFQCSSFKGERAICC